MRKRIYSLHISASITSLSFLSSSPRPHHLVLDILFKKLSANLVYQYNMSTFLLLLYKVITIVIIMTLCWCTPIKMTSLLLCYPFYPVWMGQFAPNCAILMTTIIQIAVNNVDLNSVAFVILQLTTIQPIAFLHFLEPLYYSTVYFKLVPFHQLKWHCLIETTIITSVNVNVDNHYVCVYIKP